jgi:two-component system NarL family sensor kinase
MSDGRRATRAIAWALLALAIAETGTAAVAGVLSGLSFTALLNGFVVSSATIGLTLAVAGWPIARYRPGNAVGWLLLAGGLCYGASAAGYAVLAAATEPDEDAPWWRIVATVTNAAWPWVIGLLLPLTLLVFPDGTLLGRRWRWVGVAGAASALLLVAMAVVPAETLSGELGVRGYPGRPLPEVAWVAIVETVLSTIVYVAAATSLVVRYRRGDERVRRQLLWLLLAALAMVTGFVVSAVLNLDSWLPIFAIALVPAAISVAVLRHGLLDIRLVVSRSVLYLLLTAGVIGAYAALVTVLSATLRARLDLGGSALAALLIALAFNPVRGRLQRRVDRIFYGARSDPVRAIAEVGQRLGDVAGLDGALEAICQVLRLPSATITVAGRELAAHGTPPPLRRSLPLRQGADQVGELTVGLRAGETRLDAADERVLVLLSTSLAVAVQAGLLAEQLGSARELLVTAREEERRRIRRDLHDGLGPVLTGVVLQADTARRLVSTDPDRAAGMLAELRTQTTAAIDDIRRLVNELHPPALDGLGLVGAIRERATTLSQRTDSTPLRVAVLAPDPLPDLPAAVELAAYRIATEALTNVTRHSNASTATISLTTDNATLGVRISDNGTTGGSWRAGVGLTSMRERAVELGGSCTACPGPDGGLVTATIPLRRLP